MRRKGWFPAAVRAMLVWYVERRIRHGLDGVWVRGLRPELNGPVILASTHVAWWDSMLIVRLDRELGRRASVAMHAHNLAKFPFFDVFGVFGIDATSAAAARTGMREAAKRAREGPLWWFPQGLQRPVHLRPLGLQPGILSVARQSQAPIIPVALAYAFREGHAPAAYLDFGEPLPHDTTLEALEAALIVGLERIDAASDPARTEHADSFVALEISRLSGPTGSAGLSWLWDRLMGPRRD